MLTIAETLTSNVETMSRQALANLLNGAFSHVTDPSQQQLIARAVADYTLGTVLKVGASDTTEQTESQRAALAVLLSLASAEAEDVASAVHQAVSNALQAAVKVAISAAATAIL